MANKSFISIIRNKHNFTLNVFGLSVNTTFLVNFRQRINLTIVGIILSTGWTFPLTVKRPRFTFVSSLIKLLTKLTITLRVKKPTFVFIMKQAMKLTQTINIVKPALTFVMKLAERILGFPMPIPKVVFVFNPIVASFHTLSTYDPQLLSDMDSEYLTDLDYSVTP